jgi:dihydropteroate synthase
VDIDSVGVNGLLARLSSEIDASIILATEKSTKAKGTVKEEVTAAKMMFLAKKRSTVPRDIGLDLLFYKNKRLQEQPYNRQIEEKTPVIVHQTKQSSNN